MLKAQQYRITCRDLRQQGLQTRIERIDHHAVFAANPLDRAFKFVDVLRQAQRLVEQSWGDAYTLLRQQCRQGHRCALVGFATVERYRADLDPLRQVFKLGWRLAGATGQGQAYRAGRQQAAWGEAD
ncbi:hypothetical protein D3C85_1394500 [compost metagenome]